MFPPLLFSSFVEKVSINARKTRPIRGNPRFNQSRKSNLRRYRQREGFPEDNHKTPKTLLARYENSRKHWTESQHKNALLGIAGQLAFKALLESLKIPYDMDDPLADTRKPYDFNTPAGTIEVKSHDYYCQKVPVAVDEWYDNDFLVVMKYNDETRNSVKFIGLLTRTQVVAHGITVRNSTKFNPHKDCYLIDMSELNPPQIFVDKLAK